MWVPKFEYRTHDLPLYPQMLNSALDLEGTSVPAGRRQFSDRKNCMLKSWVRWLAIVQPVGRLHPRALKVRDGESSGRPAVRQHIPDSMSGKLISFLAPHPFKAIYFFGKIRVLAYLFAKVFKTLGRNISPKITKPEQTFQQTVQIQEETVYSGYLSWLFLYTSQVTTRTVTHTFTVRSEQIARSGGFMPQIVSPTDPLVCIMDLGSHL